MNLCSVDECTGHAYKDGLCKYHTSMKNIEKEKDRGFIPSVDEFESNVRVLRTQNKASGYVYAVHGAGLFKIGKAEDPISRMSFLQCGSPVELTLHAVCTGGRVLEAALHRHLAEHRSHGEWFFPTDEVIEVIKIMQDGCGEAVWNFIEGA